MSLSGSAKILTIDDEFVLRQSIVAYLEDSGFEICEGENGAHGLEVFRKEKPDLVLTDLQMPEMSGLGVLEAVTKESPDTPIIVVSGAGGMNDVIEALRLGAWDYITKPITDLAVLEHAVCKALERARLIEENKVYRSKLEHNLQILEEDQEAGRSVQMRLLPQGAVSFGNYTCNSSVTPSLYLSGDFVDYFQATEDKAVVYLADVSGHGASSAFVTILLKSLVSQSYAMYRGEKNNTLLEPDQMVSLLSKEIYKAKLGKYLTMCYCVIDFVKHEMTYSICGHYPNPILLPVSGQPRYLEGDGFPVGILPTATFKKFSTQFTVGDKLVIFSDGVMEIFMPESDMDNKDAGLLEFVQKHKADVPEMVKNLGVLERTEQPDDVSILVCELGAVDNSTKLAGNH